MSLLRALGESLAALPEAPEWALLLVKVSLLLALAAGSATLLRKGHPARRILLWRGALLIALAMPLVTWWGPRYEVAVSQPAPAKLTFPANPALGISPAPEVSPVNTVKDSEAVAGENTAPPAPPRDWSGIIAGSLLPVWLVGIMLAGIRFGIALRQGTRLVSESRPAGEAIDFVGRQIAGALGWGHSPVIRISDEISCPLVAGMLRPALLLPADLEENAGLDDLSGILAHEISHLRGKDSQWQGGFSFLTVLLWFHPLAWLGAASHIAACEEACDAAAAKEVGDREAYRRILARVALSVRGRQPAGALPMARSSQIFRRLEALKQRPKDFLLSRKAKLALIAVGAAALLGCGGARTGLVGPAGLYEKAPAAKDLHIQLGSNEFKLKQVVRWDDKGRPLMEDGRGNSIGAGGEKLPDYKNAASWMDLADFDIVTSEPFDTLALRVFDHKTQKELSEYPGLGYEIEHSTVHLCRLGKSLPDSVDVWLRLENLPRKGPIWQLPEKVGGSVNLGGRRISVLEIRPGQWMYSAHAAGVGTPTKITWRHNQSYGAGNNPENDKNKISVAFEWGPPVRSNRMKRYQIRAVDKNGKAYIQQESDFVNEAAPVIWFDLPENELSHFEIRPFEDRYRFYFADVKLPKITRRAFTSPPPVVISVKGRASTFSSKAFAPLQISGQVLPGEWGVGVAGRESGVSTELTPLETAHPESVTTVFYKIPAYLAQDPRLTLKDASGKELPDNCSQSNTGRCGALTAGAITSRTPLEKIDSIELYLK
jgi:beta-lactamase regulating signal transducer with metallopeptidase domain